MAKKTLTNTAPGARGIRETDGELHMVDAGQTVSGDFSAEELKDHPDFKSGGAAADDDNGGGGNPGPLDGTLPDLVAHLETMTSVDELDELGKAEAAGKNRSGALNAIQARRNAIEEAANA